MPILFDFGKYRRLFIGAAACLLCTACAGDVGRLVGAGKFNTELLRKGGIVIGGVSSQTQFTLQQHIHYAELLRQIIGRRDPGLDTVGPREVYKALGGNLYSQMLDSYRFHATGSTAFMNLLHEKFPNTRYVVFARIEGNEVQHKVVQHDDGRSLDLHTIRGAGVSMRVFDLYARQLQVWAAGTQQAEGNTRRLFGHYKPAQLESLYPKPPAIEKVLTKTYIELISDLISNR